MENSTRTYLNFTQQDEPMNNYLSCTTNYNNDGTLNAFNIIATIVSSVAFLLGTTGNGMVIFFTAFKMKWSVNVVWFLNLAIADFIFTFLQVFNIAYTALGFHWPFGNFMCKLNATIMFINLYASIFLLTAISVDRCTSVVFPVWYQNHRNPRLAFFVALGGWILAFIFSLPHFIFRDTRDYKGYIRCYSNYDKYPDVYKGLVITKLIFSFILPFTVIISCYAKIMFRIQRRPMNTSGKSFKIILVVIISYFICLFPAHVFSCLELAASYTNNEHLYNVICTGMPFANILVLINSCINPFLYVFMGRNFRTNFCRSFQSVFEKAFME